MVEYEDDDSEKLSHNSVDQYIVIVDTNNDIDQMQRLTRSGLQAKIARKFVKKNGRTLSTCIIR